MLIDFFLELKSHKLPVSIKEYLTRLEAMDKKVIGQSIDAKALAAWRASLATSDSMSLE